MTTQQLKISLIGYGRMGKIVARIAHDHGHTVCCMIDDEKDWLDQKAKFNSSDVAIDFSLPGVAVSNINRSFDAKIPIVSGTTGWYKQLPEIMEACRLKDGALFYAPNFSLGMNMIFRVNKMLAQMIRDTNYEVSLREIHHTHKKDTPSGTAIKLAEDLIAISGKYAGWTDRVDDQGNLLIIESLREAEVPGTHEIVFNSKEDLIEIRHMAKSRDGFGLGAVTAAEYLIGRKGVYTMDDLINELLNALQNK